MQDLDDDDDLNLMQTVMELGSSENEGDPPLFMAVAPMAVATTSSSWPCLLGMTRPWMSRWTLLRPLQRPILGWHTGGKLSKDTVEQILNHEVNISHPTGMTVGHGGGARLGPGGCGKQVPSLQDHWAGHARDGSAP